MGFLKYILRNVSRNKLRSLLTALSVGICLAMMTVLYGFITLNDALIPELAAANRMIVMSRDGFTSSIPITVLDHVKRLDGVQSVVPLTWYLGVYRDEKMPSFAQLATDPKELLKVWFEFRLDPDQLQAWQDDRTGCIVDRRNAARYDWNVGDSIRLKGNNYSVDLELTVRGIYDGPEFINDLYFHWEYLDQELRSRNDPKAGTASILFVRAKSEKVMDQLCEQVDQRYENSDHPTLTQSHQAFAQMFTKFAGNLQVYIRNIGLAVVFSLTLVAGNAMAMSMRERTTEIALLKAIGFSRGLVLIMVLGESMAISLLGGVFGVGTGRVVWSTVHYFWPTFVPMDFIAPVVLVSGVAVAAGVGLVSGILPAVRASRLSVIDGLRRVV